MMNNINTMYVRMHTRTHTQNFSILCDLACREIVMDTSASTVIKVWVGRPGFDYRQGQGQGFFSSQQ